MVNYQMKWRRMSKTESFAQTYVRTVGVQLPAVVLFTDYLMLWRWTVQAVQASHFGIDSPKPG